MGTARPLLPDAASVTDSELETSAVCFILFFRMQLFARYWLLWRKCSRNHKFIVTSVLHLPVFSKQFLKCWLFTVVWWVSSLGCWIVIELLPYCIWLTVLAKKIFYFWKYIIQSWQSWESDICTFREKCKGTGFCFDAVLSWRSVSA